MNCFVEKSILGRFEHIYIIQSTKPIELGKPKDNKTKKVFLLQSGMLHKTVIGSDFDQETVKKVADLHLLHD